MVHLGVSMTMRHLRTCAALACDNVQRRGGRITYLTLTLTITVAAWLVLSAMAEPFVDSGTSSSAHAGVTATNGSQTRAPLPLRYTRRILAVRGARNVAWFTLMLVSCGHSTQVTLNAWGGPGAASRISTSQRPVSPIAIHRWNADPLGILISTKTAADCGWRSGDAVQPPVALGTRPVLLHISGVFRGSNDVAIAHYDYINRIGSPFGKDTVLKYVASGGSARNDELLAARIEAEFAHDFPTVNATTNATVQNAWARFGKVQQLVAFVMTGILLCAASVLVSVLAHTASQRRPKLALLQVLGFRRGLLFGALVLEVLLILIAGALIGIGLGNLAVHLVAPTKTGLVLGGFVIPIWAYAWMPVWLFGLLAVALLWPAAVIARVRPADNRAI